MDIANSCFELSMFIFSLANIRRLLRDKVVLGMHWGTIGVASLWGFFNLFYYPSLNQWWSFSAGVLLVISNSVWLGMVFYYSKKDEK